MARSPRRRIPLASVIGELTVLRTRLGFAKTSADLTPATGARTTRFCRTQQRRSSCADQSLTASRPSLSPPCNASRAQRHRVHRIPSRVRDDRDTPLLPERDGRIDRTDLPDTLSGIFLKARLDDPNHVEMAGEIRSFAQRVWRCFCKQDRAAVGRNAH